MAAGRQIGLNAEINIPLIKTKKHHSRQLRHIQLKTGRKVSEMFLPAHMDGMNNWRETNCGSLLRPCGAERVISWSACVQSLTLAHLVFFSEMLISRCFGMFAWVLEWDVTASDSCLGLSGLVLQVPPLLAVSSAVVAFFFLHVSPSCQWSTFIRNPPTLLVALSLL